MGAPPAVFADKVAVGVTSSAVAGAASPADPAGVVAADVTTLADAGMVTVCVAELANAGMAFPVDFALVVTVGVAPLANAGVVTVGVTGLADAGAASLADAGMVFLADFSRVVTVGVASLADAWMAFPADLARVVTVGVAPLADAGLVTIGVTSLADARAASLVNAGMALPSDPAGVVTVGVASPADAGLATVGVADLADDVNLQSEGIYKLNTISLPDVLGLHVRQPGAAVIRVLTGRDSRSVRALVPDDNVVDRGFHSDGDADVAASAVRPHVFTPLGDSLSPRFLTPRLVTVCNVIVRFPWCAQSRLSTFSSDTDPDLADVLCKLQPLPAPVLPVSASLSLESPSSYPAPAVPIESLARMGQ